MPITLTHPTIPATTITFSPLLGGYVPVRNLRTVIDGRNQAGVENIRGRAGARWRQWDIEAKLTAAQLAIVDELIDDQDDALAAGTAFAIQYTDMLGTTYDAKVEPADGHGVFEGNGPGGALYVCALTITEMLG